MGISAARLDSCTCSCEKRPLGTGRTDKVTSVEASPIQAKQDAEILDMPCDMDVKADAAGEPDAVADSWVPSTIAAFERLSEAVVQREELIAVFENLEDCDDAEALGDMDMQDFSSPGAGVIREASEFRIRIQRRDIMEQMCVEFDILGTCLMVISFSGGPIERYNQQCEPDEQVVAGDFFMCVNGHGGDARQITHALLRAVNMDIIVKRPRAWSILVDRGDKTSVGLGVDYTTNGASLMVTGVYPGLVRNWNMANEGTEVEVDDRIVAVNGLMGSAERMLDALKRGPPKLELQLRRV